jgi:DsbC/DsbD-like thiol-disulfide interchange protein
MMGRRVLRNRISGSLKFAWPAILAILLWPAAQAVAQEENPIQWSLKPAARLQGLKTGDVFEVVLEATIAEGWHLYALTQPPGSPVTATRISMPEGPAFILGGEIKAPAPQTDMDPNFGTETEFYEGSAAFVLPVRVLASASPGEQTIRVNAFYQTCNDQMCLPPRTDSLELSVEIRACAGIGDAQPPRAACRQPADRRILDVHTSQSPNLPDTGCRHG